MFLSSSLPFIIISLFVYISYLFTYIYIYYVCKNGGPCITVNPKPDLASLLP